MAGLHQRQQDLTWAIRTAESSNQNVVDQYYRAAEKLGDVSLAEQHPKVIAAREELATKIRGYKTDYASIGEKISTLENILRDFQW